MGKKAVPDSKRNIVIKLFDKGFSNREIQYATGLSEFTVYTIKNLYNLVKEDNWEKALAYTQKYGVNDVFRWAQEANGKYLPKEEPVVEDVVDVVEEEPVKEREVEVTVKKIDEDQIARVMLALGKILDELESLNHNMEACVEAWK